ncbi:HYC_CC_PP family protein [Chitinophagaceae bacterium MMS25-I14]
MKRLLIIPLMFLYLLAITGVMVQAHYCGKQLVSWNIYLKANNCGNCPDDQGKANAKKCCKDKVVAAKVTHEQNSVSFKLQLSDAAYVPSVTPVQYGSYPEPAYTSQQTHIHQANAPPGRWQNIALYKLHSRLTYYG